MGVIDRVRDLLDSGVGSLAVDRRGQSVDPEVRVATVVLLLEVAYGDEEYLRKEERAILRGIEHEFGIGRDEARQLVESAGWSRPPKRTIEELTGLVRDGFDAAQRERVLALVWKVVDADQKVEEFERTFVDYVASRLALGADQVLAARALARRGRV